MWLVHLLIIIGITGGLTACGYKGRLKPPAQIEKEEAKRAHKKEKEAANQEKSTPVAVPEDTGGAGNEQPVTVPSKTEMQK